jgi:hypothetical protein
MYAQSGGASAKQRGNAAQIRQMQDNGTIVLPKADRQLINTIIHDKSLDHEKKFDKKLNQLKKQHL